MAVSLLTVFSMQSINLQSTTRPLHMARTLPRQLVVTILLVTLSLVSLHFTPHLYTRTFRGDPCNMLRRSSPALLSWSRYQFISCIGKVRRLEPNRSLRKVSTKAGIKETRRGGRVALQASKDRWVRKRKRFIEKLCRNRHLWDVV